MKSRYGINFSRSTLFFVLKVIFYYLMVKRKISLKQEFAQRTKFHFDKFCENPSVWNEASCGEFINFAKYCDRSFMTEQEKQTLIVSGLTESEVEELRVVFKWTRMMEQGIIQW